MQVHVKMLWVRLFSAGFFGTMWPLSPTQSQAWGQGRPHLEKLQTDGSPVRCAGQMEGRLCGKI